MPRPKDSVTRRVGPKQTVRFDLPCGTSIYVYNPHSRLHIKPTLSRGVTIYSGDGRPAEPSQDQQERR